MLDAESNMALASTVWSPEERSNMREGSAILISFYARWQVN